MQGIGLRNNVSKFRASNYGREMKTWSDEDKGLYTIFDSKQDDILISEIYYDKVVAKFNGTIWALKGKETVQPDSNGKYSFPKYAKSVGGQLYLPCDFYGGDFMFRVDNKDLYVSQENFIDRSAWMNDFCPTILKRVRAPFNILGWPVMADNQVNFHHEYGYISFMPSEDKSKPIPEYAGACFSHCKVIKQATDWDAVDGAKTVAWLASIGVYLVVLSIFVTANYFAFIHNDKGKVALFW